MSNALDDLLDNEHAQLHGETLTHPSGRTSRVTREKDARAELRRLRAIEAGHAKSVEAAWYEGRATYGYKASTWEESTSKRALERSGS